jgi:predicted RNase H-like nuclease (RuvC/YqgF family)
MEAFGRKVDEWIQRETEAIRREERLKFDSETRELIRALQAENAALRAENAELKAEIAELKAEIAELKAENAELRARLGE